jgi:hypothetical protein
VVSIYRHCDGYPSGHGQDLYNFLKDGKLLNCSTEGKTWNGMGNLAAKLVAQLVNEGVGLVVLGSNYDADYEYTVSGSSSCGYGEHPLTVTVREQDEKKLMLKGSVSEFGEWLRDQE